MDVEPPVIPSSLRWFMVGILTAGAWAFLWLIRRRLLGLPILPAREKEPNRVSWGVGTIVLVLLSTQVLGTIVAGLYVVAKPTLATKVNTPQERLVSQDRVAKPAPAPEMFSDTEKMVLGSFATLLLLMTVPLLLKLTTGARLYDFGLTGQHIGRDLWIGFVSFLVVTPYVQIVFGLAVHVFRISARKHPLENMLRLEADRWPFIIFAYLSAVILAPVAEELIFRGLIQGWLQRLYREGQASERVADPHSAPRSTWVPRPLRGLAPSDASVNLAKVMPILITSLVFAAVHYEQMPAPFAIFVLSLALGFLYERTQRLLPSIVLHSLFNAFNTTVLVLTLLNRP